MNSEETERERIYRNNSSLVPLCERSKMKKKTPLNTVDAQWERDWDAVTSQRTPECLSLCKRNRFITEPKWRLGAFLKRTNGAFVVLLEVLRCCHIRTTLRFYCVLSERRATARTLCKLKVRAVAWRSTIFKAIPPRD